MSNPNSLINRTKRELLRRWSGEDYPGAEPRFQVSKFSKDVATFVLLPIFAVIFYKSIEAAGETKRRPPIRNEKLGVAANSSGTSQIIDFRNSNGTSSKGGFSKVSPGTLVRVKLLNVVETYSTAPVHAQVIDRSLGSLLLGGTVVGDATPDVNFDRVNINFRFVRDPRRAGVAANIAARALSLDGTLGLVASKKEEFLTRSVIGSAQTINSDQKGSDANLKDILLKALTSGLSQEFSNEAKVAKNRSQVLAISPGTEFYVELTDYFPNSHQ